jgi:hypothetical protein
MGRKVQPPSIELKTSFVVVDLCVFAVCFLHQRNCDQHTPCEKICPLGLTLVALFAGKKSNGALGARNFTLFITLGANRQVVWSA